MSNPIEQEIILQPDGNFYKRTVVTTLIQSQADAVQRVKSKPVFTVVDIPVAPKTNIAMFAGTNARKRFLFRKVDFFPLRGAVLKHRFEEAYRVAINAAPYQRANEDDEIQTRAFNDNNGLRWNPGVLGFSLYYMFSYSYVKEPRQSYVRSEGAPFVFLYSPTLKASFIPNLPNVYDSGLICTGNDFTETDTTMHRLLAANEHELNHSHCNNDLRSHRDFEADYVKFDKDGNTLPIHDEKMPQDAKGNAFFIAPTLEPILEYTKWLNSTNH